MWAWFRLILRTVRAISVTFKESSLGTVAPSSVQVARWGSPAEAKTKERVTRGAFRVCRELG
jgi:hypothetical protein